MIVMMTSAVRPWALSLIPAMFISIGCSSSVLPTQKPVFPKAFQQSAGHPSGASLGLVLTGGGAFGAWEVGALEALFRFWKKRYEEEPPIVAVAGTSTGAIIAPFVLLGRDGLEEAVSWYTHVEQGDIAAPRLGVLLPFALFVITTPSVYDVGYTAHPKENTRRLYGKLLQALPEDRIDQIASLWPSQRLAVATLDFCSGRPDPVTNSPDRITSLREAILASAMVPLAFPPVPLPTTPGDGCPAKTPHLDGSIYSVAPFSALFDVAAESPELHLTHVIVVSAFPSFPSNDRPDPSATPRDHDLVHYRPFPHNPKFKAISDRMIALFSEAGATADTRLTRAAVALRTAGLSADAVQRLTGLRISGNPPRLIELAPSSRLGWEALNFRTESMSDMFKLGVEQATDELEKQLGSD